MPPCVVLTCFVTDNPLLLTHHITHDWSYPQHPTMTFSQCVNEWPLAWSQAMCWKYRRIVLSWINLQKRKKMALAPRWHPAPIIHLKEQLLEPTCSQMTHHYELVSLCFDSLCVLQSSTHTYKNSIQRKDLCISKAKFLHYSTSTQYNISVSI